LAIRTPKGWEITDAGKQYLRNLGLTEINAAAVRIATDLRAELLKIGNPDTHAFAEEAITCYEHGLHRSAIVMAWLAAVDVLYRTVYVRCLADFNKEAKRVDPNWKLAMIWAE
jgi:hypothetical protein